MKSNILQIFFFIHLIIFQSCNQKTDIKSEIPVVKQELSILLTDPVETLDPMEILYDSDWKVASNIYETLVTFNEQDKIIPELAESYSINNEKIEYTFELRDNVYFHDSPCFKNGKGRKLNSYDIYYTFQRLASNKNNFVNIQLISPIIVGMNDYYNGITDSITGISIKDSLTIIFNLVKPYSSFLKMLTSPNFYIIPYEAINYFGSKFKYHPIGTGPFRISEFNKYEKVQLVKNENYYQHDNKGKRLPYLNSICYRTIKKSENILNQLLNKKTHIISINAKEYKKIEQGDLLESRFNILPLNKGAAFRFWGFGFLRNKNLKNYKEIRKSIAYSFNRDSIVNKENLNSVAQTILPDYMLSKHSISWYKFDSEYSKKFNGKLMNKDSLTILSNIKSLDLSALENTLKSLSIPYKIIIKPENYYKNINNLKPDLFRVSMIPSYPDPIEYYSLFYSKSSTDLNLGGFKNNKFDEIYEKILYETNDSILTNYYVQLEKILKEEVAGLYLTHQGPIYYLFPKNLHGLKFNYIRLDFRKTYFK